MTEVATPVSLTYDTGELIALDRNDRAAWARLKRASALGLLPVVPSPVVAQAWRSPRQATLARALQVLQIEPTDLAVARVAGELCAATRTTDVVDAIVVASAARRQSAVVTSDPLDLAKLAGHTTGVRLVPT